MRVSAVDLRVLRWPDSRLSQRLPRCEAQACVVRRPICHELYCRYPQRLIANPTSSCESLHWLQRSVVMKKSSERRNKRSLREAGVSAGGQWTSILAACCHANVLPGAPTLARFGIAPPGRSSCVVGMWYRCGHLHGPARDIDERVPARVGHGRHLAHG